MPLRLPLLAGLVLLLTGCDTAGPVVRAAPPVGEPVPFRVFRTGGLFADAVRNDDFTSTLVPPASVALRSEAEEEAFLEGYPRDPHWTDAGGPFYNPFPDVDYGSETAVVIALGSTGSGSIWVRLDSVVAVGAKATAYSTVVVPCLQTRDVANPSVVAAVEGPGREVDFAPQATERLPCR